MGIAQRLERLERRLIPILDQRRDDLDGLNQRSPNALFPMVREACQTVDPTLAPVLRAEHGTDEHLPVKASERPASTGACEARMGRRITEAMGPAL